MSSITQRHGVGETSLIPLARYTSRGTVRFKAEFENPAGSVKDRAACHLIEWAKGMVGPGARLVESTSGNLGVSIASLNTTGTSPLMIMDASIPIERVQRVRDAGAEVELVSEPREGMDLRQTRIAIATERGREPDSIWVDQYSNEVCAQAHRCTTAPEIWRDTGGRVDAVVAPVGSGGTVSGLAEFFREIQGGPAVIAVEPLGSTIFGGGEGPYLPLGAGMRGPTGLITRHFNAIDRHGHVSDARAARRVLDVAERYGYRLGLTSGAALEVGAAIAEQQAADVVVIAPDLLLESEDLIAALAEHADETPVPVLRSPSPARPGARSLLPDRHLVVAAS